MSETSCDGVQARLIEAGPGVFRDDPNGRGHLVECAECFAFLEAMTELDARLDTAPPLDAPDGLVERTRHSVAEQAGLTTTDVAPSEIPRAPAEPTPALPPGRMQRLLGPPWRTTKWVGAKLVATLVWLLRLPWRIASAAWRVMSRLWSTRRRRLVVSLSMASTAAVGMLLLLTTGVTYEMSSADRLMPMEEAPAFGMAVEGEPEAATRDVDALKKKIGPPEQKVELKVGKRRSVAQPEKSKGQRQAEVQQKFSKLFSGSERGGGSLLGGGGGGTLSGAIGSAGEADDGRTSGLAGLAMKNVEGAENEDVSHFAEIVLDPEADLEEDVPEEPADTDRYADNRRRGRAREGESSLGWDDGGEETEKTVVAKVPAAASPVVSEAPPPPKGEPARPVGEKRLLERLQGDDLDDQTAVDGQTRTEHRLADGDKDADAGRGRRRIADLLPGTTVDAPIESPTPTAGKRGWSAGPTQALLDRYATLEGVTFKDATGYWANTYVPGDPTMRLLASKLSRVDRSQLVAYAPRPTLLDDGARKASQPFDPPESAALTGYLTASEATLSEPKRFLVQVGLQATPRFSGRRPAMNVGLVLDLRQDVSGEVAASMRAALAAFERAQDLGDRFTLVVAGRPGGVLLEPESFAHGPLTVATQQLFGDRDVSSAPTLTLPEAVATAFERVAGSDDPTAPLGSSVVVLITPGNLYAHLSLLERMAHDGAVAGVPTSVFGVGTDLDIEAIDRVTLAGQGNRRLVAQSSDAAGAVDRELSAVARVVARAVRLRIRLAAGVKLVDVLGSYSLDEARAEQVRQAEKSIDRRLSKNLGITSDRGEDEEGIQIVIPAFYAGDSHVILLDVVADGPGAVAELTIRYKDLVHLENGVARANLTLARGTRARGPLERSVLKNLLAYETSRVLQRAGQQLAEGHATLAAQGVRDAYAIIAGVPAALPGLARDRDLAADATLLADYSALLGSSAAYEQRELLADSMRLSGMLKVLPRPERQ